MKHSISFHPISFHPSLGESIIHPMMPTKVGGWKTYTFPYKDFFICPRTIEDEGGKEILHYVSIFGIRKDQRVLAYQQLDDVNPNSDLTEYMKLVDEQAEMLESNMAKELIEMVQKQ